MPQGPSAAEHTRGEERSLGTGQPASAPPTGAHIASHGHHLAAACGGDGSQAMGTPRLPCSSLPPATSSGWTGSASSPWPAERAAVLPGRADDTPVQTSIYRRTTDTGRGGGSRLAQPARAAVPCAAGPGLAGYPAQPPPSHPPCTGQGQSHFAGDVFSEVGAVAGPRLQDSPEVGGGICW